MKVAVTGATGFIGRALCNELAKEHNVIALTRRPGKGAGLFERKVDVIKWNAERLDGWEKDLEGADAIVNLAGSNLASGRWSEKFKGEILNSRVNSTRTLLEAVKKTEERPGTFIIASATGFYGSRGDNELDEESAGGEGFLSEVCGKIEGVGEEFKELGIRMIVIRTGVVLDFGGGALPKMAMPFRFYLGGHWGGGRQWVSWISLGDEVSAIRFLIENDELEGVFNLTCPEPVRNRDFFEILAGRLKKPCLFAMPGFLLKLMFGQMADELFLASQRVYPGRLLAGGFKFKDSGLKEALETMNIGRKE